MAELDDAAVERAIKEFDLGPIIRRFGSWAVTPYGLESLRTYYPIELSRVEESDWIRHMGAKTWVDIDEFAAALDFAKRVHAQRQRVTIDGRAIRVFLCHGTEDKAQVRQLRHQLLAIGTDPWLDEEKLLPGQDWKLEISRALRRSDIVLACLSTTTVSKTGFVQRELREAVDAAAERPSGQIFIIPVRLDECVMPESLADLQRVDLFAPSGFDRLAKSLEHFAGSRG